MERPTIVISQLYRGDNSVLVHGKVGGKFSMLTLDTGATSSVISSKLQIQELYPLPGIRLRTATGEEAKVRGKTTLEVELGTMTVEHEFVVADITDEIVIGVDFMIRHGIHIDLEHFYLKCRNVELPLTIGSQQTAVLRRLSVGKDTTIPANSEALIWAKAKLSGEQGPVIVEPLGSNECSSVLVGRTLSGSVNGQIPVRVLNVSGTAKVIKKGETIARCELVAAISDCSVEPEKEQGRPSHELKARLGKWTANLEMSEREEANKLFQNYYTVFSGEGKLNGRTSVVKHHINTGDAKPIRQRPRRVPLAKRGEMEELISDMRESGVIEPSESPWCSPVVLVTKKDGNTRFCVDYRKLNDLTIKDSYPLPRIDDTLDTLSGSIWFSTLDLKSGYWQVGIEPDDKEKTAFSAGNGLWQFKVMPFGLCNAPATFERLMEYVLKGLHWKTCLLYLDDIIIMGKDFNCHLKNIEEIFKRLQAAGLKVNPKKCDFFQHEVKYLGHVVSSRGIHTDEEKTKAIKEWKRPSNLQELRSFLGLCTYYRKFVPGFATLAGPLHDLTCARQQFLWTEIQEKAFKTLKQMLCSAPILAYPIPGERFVLDTDASGSGIGGVLSQLVEGKERVIAYFSTRLSKAERNYCVTRRELLAIIKSVKHFHKYLYGQSFALRTDHAALRWLLNFKEPEGQLARWIERLQSYNFNIEHRRGVLHSNADALSRRPCDEGCRHCSKLEGQSKMECVNRCVSLPCEKWSKDNLRKEQLDDPTLTKIMSALEKGVRPEWDEVSGESPMVKAYWAQWSSFEVNDGILYRNWESVNGLERTKLIVVPHSRQEEVLKECHDGESGGHLGIKKTLEKIKTRFYWIGCKQAVASWVRHCDTCTKAKGPARKTRGVMRQYNSGAPFERIGLDVLGPFPASTRGNKFLLVVMDYFSKWPEAWPIPNMAAETCASALVENWVARFGVPMEVHSDQGRCFESSVFQEICKNLGIHKTRTTPMHPQSDGMVERFNRTLVEHLRKVVSNRQDDWEEHVPGFLMAYRAAQHETTTFSPAKILFGSDIRLPADLKFGVPCGLQLNHEDYVEKRRLLFNEIHEHTRLKTKMASDRMKARYDCRANSGGFKEGDLVLLYNPVRKKGRCAKLQCDWEGPYKIISRLNDVVYRIRSSTTPRGRMKVVHLERLMAYQGSENNIVRGRTNLGGRQ